MIVADIVRNESYATGLVPYAPFVWTGFTHRMELPEAWPDTWGAKLLEETGRRRKVLQVTRDYLNKYIKVDSYNDCVAQKGSFYFNRSLHQIWIHIEHEYTPFCSVIDYGYGFGVTSESVEYIDDYEYLPLIVSAPDLEISSDSIGASKPTGMTASIVLNSAAIVNETTGAEESPLDFLITESVFGNDVYIYCYDRTTLSDIMRLYVDAKEFNLSEITLNLEDRRWV